MGGQKIPSKKKAAREKIPNPLNIENCKFSLSFINKGFISFYSSCGFLGTIFASFLLAPGLGGTK